MKKARILRGALLLALLVLNGCRGGEHTTVITFGGDVMLAREGKPLFESGDVWGDAGSYLSTISIETPGAIFMVNLESPLSASPHGDGSSGYDLCADAGQVSLLQQGGVDLVSLANNHNLDCGVDGVDETGQVLTAASITTAGSDDTPVFMNTNEMRIGVIAAEDVSQPIDENALLDSIRAAKTQCDLLIVSMHWGNEYQAGASQRQKDLAQEIADAGADVVWGHHPHVLQPMEWLTSRNDGHRTLVMYSLGNLLSDQGMTTDTRNTALVSLLVREGEVVEIDVQPLTLDLSDKRLNHADQADSTVIRERLHLDSLSDVGVEVY